MRIIWSNIINLYKVGGSMKNKSKYVIMVSLCIVVILTAGYVSNFIYGYKIPTDTLFDVIFINLY